MKNQILLVILTLGLAFTSYAQSKNIEILLDESPDIIYSKLKTTDNYESTYQLKIKQPLDHFDLSKGFFYQKVFLNHKGFDNPTVIITEGYNLWQNRIYELTELLNANQIDIEHRFFGESMPDSLNYRYLNLKQATADLHHIKELFSNIYNGKWLSTGISKGGATTIFYRYFYPNDVDVSVPYVAPINNDFEDKRIYTFLDTIGTDECREKIKSFQILVLKNRDKILPLVKQYSLEYNYTYSYLSLAEAFEYAVMEYPFAFWQYGQSCDNIPNQTASIEDISKYFITASDISLFSDELIRAYASHYYQSATEMGYYGYETSEFKDLIIELPKDHNPHATFFPFKMNDKFDGKLLDDVNQWLLTNGNRFIYIYGGTDTWTASGVPINDKVDSEWFILKGKHHGTARIRNMNDSEKERLIETLEKWLSLKIEEQ
jgi:hypothetical protein